MEDKKRRRPKKILYVFLGCILAACVYGWSTQIEPSHFTLEKVTYQHQSIPEGFDGFKIALISDFDLKTTEDLDYLEKCIKSINKQECDMAVFVGDLYETNSIFDEERLISILKSINTERGKLAVLGENEIKNDTEACIQLIEKGGFEVLRNKAHYIYNNESAIVFAGLENSDDLNSVLSESMQHSFIITAIHQPDFFTTLQQSSSLLQLSGHSGGGFIKIPLLGAMVKVDGAKEHPITKTMGNHTLIVTNGIGMGHDQTARFNCSPNAYIITLRTSKVS